MLFRSPTSVPPATVWSRLETELAPTAPRHSRAWLPLAAAAAVALLVARGSAPVALSRATSPVALADDGDAAWLDERSYTGAIDRLQAIDNAPPDVETDPSATATIRAGLDTLDRAIADAREALDREPESVVAQEGLLDALDTKVALLQDTMAFLEDPTP